MVLAALVALSLTQSCELETRWRSRETFVIRLADGTPWATMAPFSGDPRGPKTFVTMKGREASVRVRAAGLTLRFVTSELPVTSVRPLTFADAFTTGRETPLAVVSTERAELGVVPAARTDVDALSAWKPTTVRCTELGLEGEPHGLMPGGILATPLDVRPNPTASATFRVREFVTYVELEPATAGREKKVELHFADGARLVGWVSSASSLCVSGSVSDDVGGSRRERPGQLERCSTPLALFASMGKRAEEVGALDANVAFTRGSASQGRVEVTPAETFVVLERGWRLTVSEDALARCSAP